MKLFAHFTEPESITNLKDSNESRSHFGISGTGTIKNLKCSPKVRTMDLDLEP